jgi:hypothetical protein
VRSAQPRRQTQRACIERKLLNSAPQTRYDYFL